MASSSVHWSLILYLIVWKKYSSGNQLKGKIINGEYVEISNYPHAVFLEISKSDKSIHICGSSVLNQYYLISAAHCFYALGKNGKIIALAGHENIEKANVKRTTRMSIIHSKYDPTSVANDIALVLLKKPLPLGERIQRIIIKKNFPERITGSIAGWGVINDVTQQETILLKSVTQTIISNRDCSTLNLGPGMYCAGSARTSDPRPASGDSGSGLVTGNYQLIGLLSYRVSIYPAMPVYTNVSYYYNWIKQQTQLNFCSL